MRLIKSNNVLFFHFRDGNSLIIVNALQPFSSLNAKHRITQTRTIAKGL